MKNEIIMYYDAENNNNNNNVRVRMIFADLSELLILTQFCEWIHLKSPLYFTIHG